MVHHLRCQRRIPSKAVVWLFAEMADERDPDKSLCGKEFIEGEDRLDVTLLNSTRTM